MNEEDWSKEGFQMIIVLAARNSWNVYQLDVKSAFLYGGLKEPSLLSNHKVKRKIVKNTRYTN